MKFIGFHCLLQRIVRIFKRICCIGFIHAQILRNQSAGFFIKVQKGQVGRGRDGFCLCMGGIVLADKTFCAVLCFGNFFCNYAVTPFMAAQGGKGCAGFYGLFAEDTDTVSCVSRQFTGRGNFIFNNSFMEARDIRILFFFCYIDLVADAVDDRRSLSFGYSGEDKRRIIHGNGRIDTFCACKGAGSRVENKDMFVFQAGDQIAFFVCYR